MKAGSRDHRDFLEDMAQYAIKGMHIVEDIDYRAFQRNEEKVLAAIRVIEVIGEAAKNVPPSIRNRYQDVPWSGLARVRMGGGAGRGRGRIPVHKWGEGRVSLAIFLNT